jgi:hypothetical protein
VSERDHSRDSGRTRIPGLAPDAPYSSRLSARSALYTDLRVLLDGRGDALRSKEYRTLVVEENCLGRASASARRKIWEELSARYRLDATDPLFAAFWTEWRASDSEAERGLTAYVLFALNDRLVTDLGLRWLFPRLRAAPAEFEPGDVRAFLEGTVRSHPEVGNWSEETRKAVAQKYCASIRDFGLAKGVARKVTMRPALYGAPTRLLIRALRLVDTPLFEIVQAPGFRLLGIDTPEVVDALGELNRAGALRFRIQGDVVELDLPEAA